VLDWEQILDFVLSFRNNILGSLSFAIFRDYEKWYDIIHCGHIIVRMAFLDGLCVRTVSNSNCHLIIYI